MSAAKNEQPLVVAGVDLASGEGSTLVVEFRDGRVVDVYPYEGPREVQTSAPATIPCPPPAAAFPRDVAYAALRDLALRAGIRIVGLAFVGLGLGALSGCITIRDCRETCGVAGVREYVDYTGRCICNEPSVDGGAR